MKGFVELTEFKYGEKYLLPLGTFIVIALNESVIIRPCSCNTGDMQWRCKESYNEVKALIVAAQRED